MSKRNGVIACALAGLLLGGFVLLVYSRGAEASGAPIFVDEDRPPIIVKGGSLTFESGTVDRPGKAWKDLGSKKKWDQNHAGGKKTTLFQVYFVGGSGACAPNAAKLLTVNYDHDNDGKNPRPYVVSINTEASNPGPMISSDYIDVVNNTQNTKLAATPSTGKLVNVTIGSSVCTRPREVWIESIQ